MDVIDPPQRSTALLECVDLSLRLGTTQALDSACLAVRAGEAVAVVGPSGSGKSSLLHCLSGVLRPNGGKVVLDGVRIDDLGDDELSQVRRTSFGFVFQFGELLPELNLLENVTLPLRLSNVKRRSAEPHAQRLLDALGIGDLAKRRPSEVSGGQLQRAAIARSLVHKPRVIFADEPTGALDSVTSGQVLDLLFDADVRAGAALVIVTHDERVGQRADRIVSVVDGTVAEATSSKPDEPSTPAAAVLPNTSRASNAVPS
jgi:putative ABC transport system ATP-binding protein